jgi:hypothetical protein
MAAKNMNPPIAQRAVLGVGSSPGVWVTILAARGCVGVSMFSLHDHKEIQRKHCDDRDSSQFR